MAMTKNLGTVDRGVRLGLGAGANVWASSLGWSSGGAAMLVVAAAVLSVTGILGYSPGYGMLGLNSRESGPRGRHAAPR
jgi:hypothetical protein